MAGSAVARTSCCRNAPRRWAAAAASSPASPCSTVCTSWCAGGGCEGTGERGDGEVGQSGGRGGGRQSEGKGDVLCNRSDDVCLPRSSLPCCSAVTLKKNGTSAREKSHHQDRRGERYRERALTEDDRPLVCSLYERILKEICTTVAAKIQTLCGFSFLFVSSVSLSPSLPPSLPLSSFACTVCHGGGTC